MRRRGFSVVESLVGIVVGTIVLGVAAALYLGGAGLAARLEPHIHRWAQATRVRRLMMHDLQRLGLGSRVEAIPTPHGPGVVLQYGPVPAAGDVTWTPEPDPRAGPHAGQACLMRGEAGGSSTRWVGLAIGAVGAEVERVGDAQLVRLHVDVVGGPPLVVAHAHAALDTGEALVQ